MEPKLPTFRRHCTHRWSLTIILHRTLLDRFLRYSRISYLFYHLSLRQSTSRRINLLSLRKQLKWSVQRVPPPVVARVSAEIQCWHAQRTYQTILFVYGPCFLQSGPFVVDDWCSKQVTSSTNMTTDRISTSNCPVLKRPTMFNQCSLLSTLCFQEITSLLVWSELFCDI
jgi:hypothetical protein